MYLLINIYIYLLIFIFVSVFDLLNFLFDVFI